MTYIHAQSPFKRMLSVAGLLLCIVSMYVVAPPAIAEEDKAAAEAARLKQVQQDIQKLQQLLKEIRSERNSIENRLEQTEQEINKVNNERITTEQELKEAQNTEKKQQTQRKILEQELVEKKQGVAQSVRAAYLAGQSPQLKLLLNQDDPQQANRMLSYYKHFNEEQTDTLRELFETSEKLAIVEQEIAVTKEQIQSRHKRLLAQQEKLKDTKTARTRALQELDSQMSQSSTRMNKLEQEEHNLQKVVSSIMALPVPKKPVKTTAAKLTPTVETPFNKVRGKLRWPIKGKVVHRYGERRDNTRFAWNGIFIRAKAGTNVIAPHNGRVVFSNWMPSFGQLLILDHGKGYMTLYAHNQELLKGEGEWVLSGEPIARVGDSGGLSDPGLYFEIRYKGKPSNPATWLTTSRQ